MVVMEMSDDESDPEAQGEDLTMVVRLVRQASFLIAFHLSLWL